jgi:secreted trypsin-like serine protease
LEGISGPGDSGGPALIGRNNELYIVGISSNQEGEGHKKGTYGVIEYYTRISSYYNWLVKTMKQPSINR